jgi:hypothetical protein
MLCSHSARRAGHEIDRAGFGLQREPLAFGRGRSPEAQLAVRSQRKSEDAVEVRLVTVPADPDADVVFRAEYLLDPR